MQQHLPNYFSADFMRKCFISTHKNIADLQKGSQSSKIIQSRQSGQNWMKLQHKISGESNLFKQKNVEVFLVPTRY